MKSIAVSRRINAPAAGVWSILTSPEILQDGELGILRIEGRIGPGERIRLWSEVSPDRAFSLNVVTFDPPRRMVWKGGMPLGLFTGTRRFDLSPSEGGTELHIDEQFSGPLASVIWKSMPDLRPSFDKLADGIKRLAEEKAT